MPRLVVQVGLLIVQHKAAGKFSGGMKRRLSVAMSYIGDPKVVILDEPTTGMDPYSRKFVWRMIADRRTGRTPLLTVSSSPSPPPPPPP